jgi:hypothetical protein
MTRFPEILPLHYRCAAVRVRYIPEVIAVICNCPTIGCG